ncbi:ParA family protein (plasmid) [Mycolicibacterium aichiense]|uniref:ParA family protein n=1 Tax=Mycolicibacterium aichiense TaxID=1799 RepID=UPI003D67A734
MSRSDHAVSTAQHHCAAHPRGTRSVGGVRCCTRVHPSERSDSCESRSDRYRQPQGGVGKSFTAVNLAAGLARGGWRTLLVDCDPQSNATSMFDPEDDVEFDIYDLIKEDVPFDKVVRRTRLDNLDLVPATLAVAKLDQELVTMHRREDQLTMALAPAFPDYDAIVLDLSPNLGQLVITALNAAEWLVVPTDASKWGRRGSTCSSSGR